LWLEKAPLCPFRPFIDLDGSNAGARLDNVEVIAGGAILGLVRVGDELLFEDVLVGDGVDVVVPAAGTDPREVDDGVDRMDRDGEVLVFSDPRRCPPRPSTGLLLLCTRWLCDEFDRVPWVCPCFCECADDCR
jgi:hypothetical protein